MGLKHINYHLPVTGCIEEIKTGQQDWNSAGEEVDKHHKLQWHVITPGDPLWTVGF